ncbi:MAG: ester cyclase [Chloroflexota bacterium]|nr:ester cyclase [Chloroflexota bacterium]
MFSGSHGLEEAHATAIQRARTEAFRRPKHARATNQSTQQVPRPSPLLGFALVLLTGLLAGAVMVPRLADASATDPTMVAVRFYEELHTTGDLDIAAELVAPGAFIHTPDGTMRGPEGIAGLVTTLRTAFPDATFPIAEIAVANDTVLVRWTMHGTHRGTFGDIAPTGKKVSMDGIAVLRVRDGKIVENWVQYDRLGLLQQLDGTQTEVPRSPACGECRPEA